MERPAGTVTLLFTDVEGSTALAHGLGSDWGDVLTAHRELVGAAITAHGGHVDSTEGDAFFAVFADARQGLSAAVDAQRRLRARRWPTPDGALKVRMGLHTGHVERRDTGYVGLEIHRAARVAAAAHGGQVLLTDAVRVLAGDVVATEDLGRHRLKDFPAPEQLHHVVLDGEGADAFPPPRTLVVRPTNLPADDRPLLGREEDLEAVVATFTARGERLLTLTGMGGTGKTRLAHAAAAALLDEHPGGVWWVPLATATDETEILATVAAALRADDTGARPTLDVIAGRVGTTPTLVVLDNLEHLPGAAGVVSELLAAAPGVRVLATSQLALRLTAERVVALEPLSADASRALFRQAGERVRPGLTLDDPETADVVDELCERLDHLPLAIELAAGRLAVLTPAQLLERLAEPLKLLRGGERDRPARQRSLQATVDWTLGLLDPEPRRLFTRLGVFAGAVELEDVEAVCDDGEGDVLAAIAALLDAGILRRREDGTGAVRLRLPEALRQVAAAELAEAADGARWLRAHAEHVLGRIAPAAAVMACTLDEFEQAWAWDQEAALALSRLWERDPELACRLGGARAAILGDRGQVRDARLLAERVLAHPAAPAESRALAHLGAGYTLSTRGDFDDAAANVRRALDLDPPPLIAFSVQSIINWCAAFSGAPRLDWDVALVERARALGNGPALATSLTMQSQAAMMAGDLELAAASLAEAVPVAIAAGAKVLKSIDSITADLAMKTGRFEEAVAGYLRSGSAAEARGDGFQTLFDLLGLAGALAAAGQPDAALEVLGLAEGHAAGIGSDAGDEPWMAVTGREHVDRVQDARGPAAGALVARGRAVPAGARLARARALTRTPNPQPT